MALELAQDIGESVFTLHELPRQEPFLSLVQQWALLRRRALVIVSKIQMKAREHART